MGQEKVKEVLINERNCSNNEYLSVREIHKALENIGEIIRMDTLYKNIKQLHKYGTLERDFKGSWKKRYRIKSIYLNNETK